MKKKKGKSYLLVTIAICLAIFAILDPHFIYERQHHIKVVKACYASQIPTAFGGCHFSGKGKINVTYKCPEMIQEDLCSLSSCWIVGEGACNIEYWSDDLIFNLGIVR